MLILTGPQRFDHPARPEEGLGGHRRAIRFCPQAVQLRQGVGQQDGLLTEPMEQRCYLRYNDKLCDYEEMHMERGSAVCIFSDIRASGLSSQEFALRLLNEHAVACVPGAAFGPCGEGFVRMSYATSLAKIKLAVERLAAFMRDLAKG